MSFKAKIVQSLKQLAHRPVIEAVRTWPEPLAPSDGEQVVYTALFPDIDRPICYLFENIYPSNKIPGFTSELDLNDLEEHTVVPIRRVLSAGAALHLVRPDDIDGNKFYVHAEFYKLLTRVRSGAPTQSGTLALRNGLTVGERVVMSPSEGQIAEALDDIAAERSEFIILDRGPDYLQAATYAKEVAHGEQIFILEARVHLNDTYYEHFRIADESTFGPSGFDNLDKVREVVLHWIRTGKLPPRTRVMNVSSEFREPPQHQAAAQDTGGTEGPTR